jgi:hypothetical protein
MGVGMAPHMSKTTKRKLNNKIKRRKKKLKEEFTNGLKC